MLFLVASIVKKSEEIKQPSSPAKAAMSYLEQQKKSPDETKQPSLLQNLLQKAANSWDCTECYASNPKSSTNCLCCDAANPSVPKRDSGKKTIFLNFYHFFLFFCHF